MKTPKLLFALLILVAMGCKKGDKIPEKEEEQQQKIEKVIPDQYLQVLKDMGMTIYEGTNPPDVNGIYHLSPNILFKTNIDKDYEIGTLFNDARIGFSSLNLNDFTLKVNSNEESGISESTKAVVSGSGNNFTVYSMEIVKIGTNSAVIANLYSGTMDGTSIKNLKRAGINVDNSNGGTEFLAEGEARIFNDGDNISERVTSLDLITKVGAGLPAAHEFLKLKK